MAVSEAQIRDENALEEASTLWLAAVKKGDVEKEKILGDVFDLMNKAVAKNELEYYHALLKSIM